VSKIGLKFNVLTTLTLVPGGVVSWNFAMWRAARYWW